MATSNALDMERPHHRHTWPIARPAADQRPGSIQSQEEEEEAQEDQNDQRQEEEEEEDQPGDHIAAMIEGTLAMLEGQQGVGVFCVCEPACVCKEVCAVAARHTRCACTCYDAFWCEHAAVNAARVAQAPVVEEERPVTPRSVSVYSQGSIQASLLGNQAHAPANNHSSLSGEGTWSASRAQLWARLPAPGPPTPSKAPKPNANRG